MRRQKTPQWPGAEAALPEATMLSPGDGRLGSWERGICAPSLYGFTSSVVRSTC